MDITDTAYVYTAFIIDDLLGKYENPSIWIKKAISEDVVVIQSDFTDIEDKVGSYLIENDEYIIEASNTTSYTAGEYNWVSYITRSSDSARIKLSEGFTEIQQNYATTTSSVRSHAKKVLDAIEAVIENRATMDQSSMSIAGRSLSRLTVDELMTFRDRYKAEYLKEIKLARIKNKQGSGNSIKVRF
jgi:hypothetical protein